MKVSGALSVEGAVGSLTVLGGAEPLESFLDDGRVFSVVIGVHLHVRRADVHLVASFLDAVVVRLLAVVRAAAVAVVAVVARRVPHESVLQRLVPLLVPLEVTDHFLFLHKHTRMAIQTVEMFPVDGFCGSKKERNE